MRKPVYAKCKQQRCRSACASAQSDQHLCFRCLDSIIPLVSISEIPSLCLASVAAQACLSLTRSKTPKTGFLVTRLNYQSSLIWVCLPRHICPKTQEHCRVHVQNCAFFAAPRTYSKRFFTSSSVPGVKFWVSEKQIQQMSRLMTKPTKWLCAQRRLKISLGICPVWSESSLCAQ